MKGTLDEIFAYCKELGEEDYKILITKLKEEESNRAHRVQRDCWNKVVEALENYIRLYGSVVVVDNEDGSGITLNEMWTHHPGIIEVG